MSQAAEASLKVVKPRMICGLDGCVKEYPKSYMKTHQKSKIHNPSAHVDTTAEAVNEDVNDTNKSVDETNEALCGGTQELVNTVEALEDDKALEAENEVFDDLGNILEGDLHIITMVTHMVTPRLFAGP